MTQQASNGSKEDIGKKKNKVLVAGASGLIGVAAIEAFLSAGWAAGDGVCWSNWLSAADADTSAGSSTPLWPRISPPSQRYGRVRRQDRLASMISSVRWSEAARSVVALSAWRVRASTLSASVPTSPGWLAASARTSPGSLWASILNARLVVSASATGFHCSRSYAWATTRRRRKVASNGDSVKLLMARVMCRWTDRRTDDWKSATSSRPIRGLARTITGRRVARRPVS